MPVRMVQVKRSGRTVSYRAVDPGGKIAATFTVGRTVAGKLIRTAADARARARAFVQARNLAERRRQGKPAPPAPRKNR